MTAHRPLAAGLRAAGFRGELRSDAPLAPFTTWQIGGPAELLATPRARDDLIVAVRWAQQAGVAWRVLGNGSNLLVRDEGVGGLVLRVRRTLDEVHRDGRRLTAGAGAPFPTLARLAARHGLSGIEFGGGIPGTLGGAIVMNAGWHEHEIGHRVESVELLRPDGETRRFDAQACRFDYRTSRFRRSPGVVLQATLELEPDDPHSIRRRMKDYVESRKSHQPTELPSCGSVFLKPEGDFAGRLIDCAGLKGLRVGDLEVSTKHANFFVNLGRGRCVDALELVERVEREVEARFGVRLVREFELW